MLIVVPSSESKRPAVASGAPVVLEELSFPALLPTRRRIAEALVATSADLDIRSPSYQATGMPAGLDDRTVVLRIGQGVPSQRIGEVITKRARRAAARYLLESGADPGDPDALANVLAERPVQLSSPDKPGKPWTITLSID